MLCITATVQVMAQGTLSDTLVLRNAGNGRVTLAPNSSTTPAGSWRITFPQSTSPTGSLFYGTLTGSNVDLTWLPPGSNDQVLTLAGGVPTWATAPGWLTTGNTIASSWDGTSGSFLGTLNGQDLVINTNGVFRARLVGGATNTGNLVLGTTTASPTNTLATDADDRLTVLGGDISLNSEGSGAITRQLLFRGTAGSGNFRVGADGGDFFWQGGGGQRLQEGSYWGIEIRGHRGTSAFPAFVAGAGSDPHVNMIAAQDNDPILVLTPTAAFTDNQQEWRNSGGTALSIVDADGDVGIGVITGLTSKLQINAASTTGNAIQLDPWGNGAGNTGEIRFRELSTNGTNYAAFKAADAMANSNTYTLPSAVGSAGQTLSIASVSGNDATLAWTTSGGAILEEVTAGTANIRRKIAYTSGTVGVPGLYATDLMGARNNAAQTASGNYAGLLAGSNNTASANYSAVVAGTGNTSSSSYAFIGAGAFNTASANYSSVLGGTSNSVSGSNSSILGGESNTVSGAYSMAFGRGANVSQANTVVFNYPNVDDGATRVGIDINDPQTSLDVDGGLVVRPPGNVPVPANNYTIAIGNRSYIVLDPAGGNRTGLILPNGLQAGQILVLRILETSGNYIQLPDAAANNAALTGNWVGRANDTITLIWSGVDWVEISRSNN